VLLKKITISILSLVLCVASVEDSKAHVDPEMGTYKKTTARLESVLENLNFNVHASIFRSRHNGFRDHKHYNRKRDNVLIVPEAAIPDSITLVVWMHGLSGFSEKTFKRVLTQMNEITKRGHSIAVVIPEMPWSINTTTRRSRQGLVWNYPGEFDGFVNDTLEKLSSWSTSEYQLDIKNTNIVVVGHSAGGSAIASASSEGSLCDSRVTDVVWSDASYGKWLDKAYTGCLGDFSARSHILVRKWDSPYKNAEQFLQEDSKKREIYKYRVLSRKKYTHTKIGNKALLLTDLFPIGC